MISNQVLRRLEQIETLTDTHDDQPPFDIEIVFVEAVEGLPGGRIKRVVKLSDLRKKAEGTSSKDQR